MEQHDFGSWGTQFDPIIGGEWEYEVRKRLSLGDALREGEESGFEKDFDFEKHVQGLDA
jgi:hypothetical protein